MQPYGAQQMPMSQVVYVVLQAPLTQRVFSQPLMMAACVVMTPPWQSPSLTQATQPAAVQKGAAAPQVVV